VIRIKAEKRKEKERKRKEKEHTRLIAAHLSPNKFSLTECFIDIFKVTKNTTLSIQVTTIPSTGHSLGRKSNISSSRYYKLIIKIL
jgi:hypothetical protein